MSLALHEIPIVGAFSSGNIDVETITVTPNPLDPIDSSYQIELLGRTR